MRNFYQSGRSTVYATNCAVATSHPLSSSTAMDILNRGGSAMDAAIAAAAVLGVVEPTETGLGGDCFALIAPKGQMPPIAFNGSGYSPSNINLNYFTEKKINHIESDSVHSVTIPGALDAWIKLHSKFGNLDFNALLQPAINYAENGFVIHDRVHETWNFAKTRLKKDKNANEIFLPNGQVPKIGQKFVNIPLANTLKKICKNGRDEFYKGETSENIIKYLKDLGSFHTPDDFASYSGEYVTPISSQYRDIEVFQLPPNTQGIIALIMLKILEKFNLSNFDFFDLQRVHIGIEASKLSYIIRNKYLGSDTNSETLINILNNDKIISELTESININKCIEPNFSINLNNSNTVYLTIVDKDKNCVSFINSIYESFGSGICPTNTGILLQNRGKSFVLLKDHPNCLGPKKRPAHTIMPGILGKNNMVNLSYGVMGGDYQPMGHAQIISALYDHKMDLQESCNLPRYYWNNNKVFVEKSFNPNLIKHMNELGHKVLYNEEPLGGAQLIAIDWEKGVISAASDPRKDGLALGS